MTNPVIYVLIKPTKTVNKPFPSTTMFFMDSKKSILPISAQWSIPNNIDVDRSVVPGSKSDVDEIVEFHCSLDPRWEPGE